MTIEDRGNGLRPRPDSPGLGYGLALDGGGGRATRGTVGREPGHPLRAWFSRDPAVATPAD